MISSTYFELVKQLQQLDSVLEILGETQNWIKVTPDDGTKCVKLLV